MEVSSLFPGSVTAEVVTVTPEMADDLLTKLRYAGQRQLREWWVEDLCQEHKLGRLAPCAIDIGHLIGSDDPGLLLNGQHRLTAISTVRKPATMVLVHHYVETQAQIEQVYRRIDRGKTRPLADTVGPELSKVTQLSRGQIRYAGAACKLIMGQFKPHFQVTTRSLDDQVAAVIEWGSEAHDYFGLLDGAQESLNKRMCKSSVMAVALVTLRDCPEKAREFWRLVARNDGLRAGSAPQALVNLLLGASSTNWRATAPEQARMVAACWNAFYQNRDISRIKPSSISNPIVISGSKDFRAPNEKHSRNR